MDWIVPAVLGACHGLNPAMGWLFAVALGFQERRVAAVLRALPPIALGHAAAIAAVLAAATGASMVVPPLLLRVAGALLLLGFAARQLLRPRHPRRVGMRLGARGLTVWSFAMSSAHGAGLMLLPVLAPGLLDSPDAGAAPLHAHAGLPAHAAAGSVLVLAIHSAAMFAAMATTALLVYRVLGVGFLRRAWLNTDVLWNAALAVSGLVLLLSA